MIIYASLFLVGLVSGLLVFFRSKLKKYTTTVLSFSGAYLLSVCLLHLMPELFNSHDHNHHLNLGIFLLIGFFLQLILDYFSGGIEHGHAHVNHSKLGKFPWLVFLSLCIHAFLEAFPLLELNQNNAIGSYLGGLLVHKIPISFILASLLLGYQLPKKGIILGIVVFSLMAPLGVWAGSQFTENEILFKRLLALSLGIILHLSTTILLESNEEHKIEWKKLLPMLAGASLAVLSSLGH
jgi:zinc transporter ZupT